MIPLPRLQVLAVVFLALLANAITAMKTNTLESRYDRKDFLLSNISAFSEAVAEENSLKRTLKFEFLDNNSMTTANCLQTWNDTTKDNGSTFTANPPILPYVLCDTTGTGVDNSFRWHFSDSYTTFGNFTINLAHSIRDDINFEPPYDIVTFFSIDFNLILDCPSTYSEKTTTTCHLPNNATSVVAPVNGITA